MTARLPGEYDPRFQFAVVMVRDQDRSLQFYVDQLGFRVVADQKVPFWGTLDPLLSLRTGRCDWRW